MKKSYNQTLIIELDQIQISRSTTFIEVSEFNICLSWPWPDNYIDLVIMFQAFLN